MGATASVPLRKASIINSETVHSEPSQGISQRYTILSEEVH